MINTISFSYPWWYLLFCLALGAGYGWLMYVKENRFSDLSHWFIKGLGLLRALSVALIALLLLSPFIKTIKDEIKSPIIVIASDKSESIAEGMTKNDLEQYGQSIEQLKAELKDKFDIKEITFGSDVHLDKQDSLTDKSTNLSHLLTHISDNYGDQNLGALIIGTDGIYNEGSHPLYLDTKLNAPIYTIALGDTTQKKDLYFQNVLHNKIAYLGDKFPVQADISAYNCEGSTSRLTLERISGGQTFKISDEILPINAKNYFATKPFIVDANQSGIIRYRLRLTTITGENNITNNVKDFFIEVLDARQKILLLGNAPHPDLGALKTIITQNKNYEVEIAFLKDFTGNIANYNLVILHNLPSEESDISSILLQLDRNKTPRIFIVGMQTSIPRFNRSQEILNIIGNSRNNEDILADFNPAFTLFTTSDELKNKIKTFPPLQTPFGEYKLAGTGSVYMYQNIKKIKTNYPLIVFDEKNGIKTTVICGEGIWKWRLFDHLQHKNYDLVSEMVGKTILLTSSKADKRKFRTSTSKNLYKDNESILIDAQLYNDNYEMINDPDVKLVIKDESGKEYNYTFSKTQNYYTLNADVFPQGAYSYTASVNYNGKVETASGRFIVASVQLEQYDLTARHGLLKSLSEKYSGETVYVSGIASLKEKLLNDSNIKPVLYQTNSTKAIIHLKWLFFLILTLLSLEWFMRRYYGSY
ncbi:MAG: hypothetical protein WAU01_06605 [Saprospiraceae bacterium]